MSVEPICLSPGVKGSRSRPAGGVIRGTRRRKHWGIELLPRCMDLPSRVLGCFHPATRADLANHMSFAGSRGAEKTITRPVRGCAKRRPRGQRGGLRVRLVPHRGPGRGCPPRLTRLTSLVAPKASGRGVGTPSSQASIGLGKDGIRGCLRQWKRVGGTKR